MPAQPTTTPPVSIAVRSVDPGDALALQHLYESLDTEERWHRFANAYHPPFGFYTELAAVGARGGARVVAVTPAGPGVGERIVGEAGYERTGDEGELTVAIAPGWHVHVAAVLVDAVTQTAADAGVANLEIEIHRHDQLLHDLFRQRGAMIGASDGWAMSRLRFGTSGSVTWPVDHHRPRLLVEGAGGRWPVVATARQMGYDVLSCPGPERGECPALAGETCSAAAEADAIVIARPTEHVCWPRLRAAHRELHPDVPVSWSPWRTERMWTV